MPDAATPDSADSDQVRAGTQTLDRGLRVLEAVAAAARPVSVAEVAATLGIHRTMVHRLAITLTTRGYLHRDPRGRYQLGGTCLSLAATVPDLRNLARPFLEDLARRTSETVHLAVLAGRDVVFLEGIESPQALRVASRTGRSLPAHATSVGKAWLAALAPDRLHQRYPEEDLPPVTAATLVSRARLEQVLDAVRRDGYATSRGESEPGVGSVGAVVCDASGEPRAAISVAVPLDRFTDETERAVAQALLATADTLAAHLS